MLSADKTTTQLLADIGVRHEPAPGYIGCRHLFADATEIGYMHVFQANDFIIRANSAA